MQTAKNQIDNRGTVIGLRESFRWFAHGSSDFAGEPLVFLIAVAIIVIWLFSGPFFHYSDTWQLVINTGTSVITFLMVFLIQNSQTRDTREIHLKLDELIRAIATARNQFMGLKELSDEDLQRLADTLITETAKRRPIASS
jgi:low affinity Fe/Cu permease